MGTKKPLAGPSCRNSIARTSTFNTFVLKVIRIIYRICVLVNRAKHLSPSGIVNCKKKKYNLAAKGKYLVVVFNTKDFVPLIYRNKPSVISLSTGLMNNQIDLKLCKLLKTIKPSE